MEKVQKMKERREEETVIENDIGERQCKGNKRKRESVKEERKEVVEKRRKVKYVGVREQGPVMNVKRNILMTSLNVPNKPLTEALYASTPGYTNGENVSTS